MLNCFLVKKSEPNWVEAVVVIMAIGGLVFLWAGQM